MKLGSKKHKLQVCQDLIKQYHENIWKDEINLVYFEEIKAAKETEIKAIESKLERKEYQTKNEGEKAKFVAEQELAGIQAKIDELTLQLKVLWPTRIRHVEQYMAKSE